MGAKIRLLNYLFNKGVFQAEDFYCVGTDSYKITLQGHIESTVIFKYQKKFNCKFSVCEQGWAEVDLGNIKIVLT